MWIATADRAREMDRRARDEFGIPTRVLMERAGLAVFDVVREMLPEGGKLAIFCGKGNNGGDAFVTARAALDAGYSVVCLVAAEAGELSPDADEQRHISQTQGVEPIYASDARFARHLARLGCFDLIVDGLLGTGARGHVAGAIKTCIEAINHSGVPVLAVDVPSGIQSDTGEELGDSIWALRTVTFGLPKPCLFQGTGLEHSGYWTVADIGFPKNLLHEPTGVKMVCPAAVGRILPERMRASHKGDNGRLLIVAGSEGMPGAASLAALAALRAGIGLVTVASIPSVCHAVAANVPEALLLPLPERFGAISPDAARTLLEAQEKADAAVFGPGLTCRESILNLLSEVWDQWALPSVIDADALNSVSQGVPLPASPCVMTPHPGEMGRLLESSVAEVQNDRLQTARAAVERFGKTVVLKGAFTLVGSPDEPISVNSSGNPGMASAGMGDVLSGLIGTLLAQDIPLPLAAVAGVYWHGLAADLAADEIGGIGFLARDVANRLSQARAKITASCDASSSFLPG